MKTQVTKYELDDPELLELVSPEMDKWLNSWSPEERQHHSGHYVAVSVDRHIVASDKSARRLQKTLDRLGAKKVRVFYMEPPDAAVIY